RPALQQYRRLRLTINGVIYYSEVVSSALSSGNTNVTILDSILTNKLTLVEYSIAPALGAPDTLFSPTDLNQRIATVIVEAGAISSLTDDDTFGMVESGGLKSLTWLSLRTFIQG